VVAYNGRWLPQARGYWQRALFTDPRLLGDPSLLARWLKSWLGATGSNAHVASAVARSVHDSGARMQLAPMA
jgi:hypothetical protein